MPVVGKKKSDWEVRTYCDFGTPPRKEVLRTHFSIDAALRSYNELEKIYGSNSLLVGRCTHAAFRVWQETRSGDVINDNLAQSKNLPSVSAG
jgi:hypothetical protein